MKKIISIILIIFIIFFIFINISFEETVAENQDIVLGQSCALSGPAGALGSAFMNGANSYFGEVNAKGGVNGHKIKLISMDDYYEPNYAVKNTVDLIKNKKVFAMFGEIGTPTSKAVLPIITKHKIPFLMPFTGAKFLREPKNRYIINMRSSYEHETQALIEYLTQVDKKSKIAIFYQNDSYGQAGLYGVEKALKAKGLALVAEGKYRRNTLLIESAITTILDKKPDAIVMIGAYKPCALFIEEVKRRTYQEITFANISFVGSRALVNALNEKMDNVIISQVVPISNKLNKKEHRNFVYTEGYLAAKLFVKAVENTKSPLTREKFLDSFSKLAPTSLGGYLHLNIKNDTFNGLDKVYITKYKEGEFIELMEHTQ